MVIVDSYYLNDVVVVLTQGELGQHLGYGDYAAYIGLSSRGEELVSQTGTKLSPYQCKGFFPYINIEEYRI